MDPPIEGRIEHEDGADEHHVHQEHHSLQTQGRPLRPIGEAGAGLCGGGGRHCRRRRRIRRRGGGGGEGVAKRQE